jgi:murein DD-endopeptidase MepM/ murein hydrolase activator NlpD
MERKSKLLAAGVLAIGAELVLAQAVKPKESQTPLLDPQSPTPTVFAPSSIVFNLEPLLDAAAAVNPTETPFIDLTPNSTSSPTPEIPFGEHKCVLPLNIPFKITQGFLEPSTNKTQGHIRHMGVDFGGVKEGDSVLNICDSELVWAGPTEGNPGLGNVVIVKDVLSGNYILSAHLSSFTNKTPGEKILAGEEIGKVGHSGTPRDHLHLMIFTPYGWSEIERGTNQFYGGNYGLSLTGYYINLQPINDEEVAKRLVNPVIFIYEKTGIEVWKVAS